MNNKPNIIISRCIEHESCRYNGEIIKNPFILSLKERVNFITICPEVDSGMSIPREPANLVERYGKKRFIGTITKIDSTEKITNFTNDFIERFRNLKISGIILKSSSPSCGIKTTKLYNENNFNTPLELTSTGIFAEKILEYYTNIPVLSEKDLEHEDVKELFLKLIFR